MSKPLGPDEHQQREEIHSQALRRARPSQAGKRRTSRALISILSLHLVLVLLSGVTLLATRQAFRRQSLEAATRESRFVTTEWALLRELQQRTQRVLREKDREIASLRELQASLAGRPELADEAERVRVALLQAYAERETVLQAQLSGSGEELAQAVRSVETGTESALAEMITENDPETLAWYRRIVDLLRTGRPDSAQVRLETTGRNSSLLPENDFTRLLGLVTIVDRQEAFLESIRALERELDRRDLQIAGLESDLRERADEIERSVGRIRSLEEELATVVDERLTPLEAQALRVELQAELAGAFEQGTDQTFSAVEQLLDYLSGARVPDLEETRTQILTYWANSQRFQELVTRSRRLATNGVAAGRDDLPEPRLIGIVTDVREQTLLIEGLTDIPAVAGTPVEIRSSEGVQPGSLIGRAEIAAVTGDLISATLGEQSRSPRARDLVYVVIAPSADR